MRIPILMLVNSTDAIRDISLGGGDRGAGWHSPIGAVRGISKRAGGRDKGFSDPPISHFGPT